MYTLKRFQKKVSVEEYIKGYVNVAEFLEYCRQCPNYDKVWSCPGHDFDPEEYWRAYSSLNLLGYKINFDGTETENRCMEIMAEVKRNLA